MTAINANNEKERVTFTAMILDYSIWLVPSGNLTYLLKMAIGIVDFPIFPLKMVIFHSYVSLPEGSGLEKPIASPQMNSLTLRICNFQRNIISITSLCLARSLLIFGDGVVLEYVHTYIYTHT